MNGARAEPPTNTIKNDKTNRMRISGINQYFLRVLRKLINSFRNSIMRMIDCLKSMYHILFGIEVLSFDEGRLPAFPKLP
jgi:hypothetical protein